MIIASARHVPFKNYHFSKKSRATIRRVFWSCNLFHQSVVAALSFCKYTNYPSYSLSYLFLHNSLSPLLAAFSCTCFSYSPSSSSFSSPDATTLHWLGPINKITSGSPIFEDLFPISQF
jgi:hypothetical protein